MAAPPPAIRPRWRRPPRACGSRDGRARVEIAGHEIGNGAYTVIGQAAAERLGSADRKGFRLHRRQRSAAGAGGRRLQLDRQHLLGGDDGLRQDQAAPVQGADAEGKRWSTRPRRRSASAGRRRRRPPKSDRRSISRRHSTRSASASSRNMASGSPTARRWIPSAPCTRARCAWSAAPNQGRDSLCLRCRVCRGTHQPLDPRNPRAAAGRRLRRRPHHEPAHRAKPADGRVDLGHVVGVASRRPRSTRAMRATSTTIWPTICCR